MGVVKLVTQDCSQFIDLLHNVLSDQVETTETFWSTSYDFIYLHEFWHSSLSLVDRVQKRLQDRQMNFIDAARDKSSHQTHFEKNSTKSI